MLLAQLREEICRLHAELPKNNLVAWTSGNISARDPASDLVVIKPSGLRFEDLTPENMVLTDLDGRVVQGDLSPSSDTAHLLNVCRTGEVDGVILFSTHYDSAIMDTLLREQFPFVVIGREICDRRVSYVVPDYYGGTYRATRYLIELGHNRIAFTTRPELSTANESRFKGHLDALRDAGIRFDEELIVETRLEPGSAIRAAEQLLRLRPLPTAVCAFHDLVALDIVEVFLRHGLRVPEDVSVIGFDGLRAGFMTIPHITTVAQQLAYSGKRVMEIINELIERPDGEPIQEIVPVELVIRGSTSARTEAPEGGYRQAN